MSDCNRELFARRSEGRQLVQLRMDTSGGAVCSHLDCVYIGRSLTVCVAMRSVCWCLLLKRRKNLLFGLGRRKCFLQKLEQSDTSVCQPPSFLLGPIHTSSRSRSAREPRKKPPRHHQHDGRVHYVRRHLRICHRRGGRQKRSRRATVLCLSKNIHPSKRRRRRSSRRRAAKGAARDGRHRGAGRGGLRRRAGAGVRRRSHGQRGACVIRLLSLSQ
jgi:hypothetical protein